MSSLVSPAAETEVPARAPAQALQTTWELQSLWSRAANTAKRRYLLGGRVSLGLSIAAAACATATTQVSATAANRVLAATSATLVAVTALIARRMTGPASLREWIRARSASEGLKTEAYRYLTRTGPYAAGDAARTLSERTATITAAIEDLSRLIAAVRVGAIPPGSDPMPIEHYLKVRVDSQINDYYGPRAAAEAMLVRRFQLAELVLALAGAMLGAASALSARSGLAPWSAVITTAMAAISAHLAASRHESQVTTYTATKIRLRQLLDRFRDDARQAPPAQRRIDELVSECEAVISVENQGWMAEWDKTKS